ncbi:MAG: two-component sensor histidine kinase [Chloroflexi bacterium]|nr:two-component sensor histidine kinase [Chloroflexota bacterium]
MRLRYIVRAMTLRQVLSKLTGMMGRSWTVPRGTWVRAAQVGALELLVVGGTFVVEAAAPHGGPRAPDATGYLLLALAAGATGLSPWSPLGALGLTLAAALTYVGRGGSEHGPLVFAVMVALYGAVRPERPWRTLLVGGTTLVGFHAVGVVSPTAGLHAFAPGSSAAGEFVASFVSRLGWIALPLVLGHAVASARGKRAAAEERARLAEQTREEHAQRRVAEERLRIARELHDVVSHSISVINLQAGVAAHVMDEQPEQTRQALLTIKSTSKEALGELRGILGLLRQGDEDESRAPAPRLDQLGALVEATSRVGVPTRLSVDGHPRPLAPAVELAAYRIVPGEPRECAPPRRRGVGGGHPPLRG